MDDYFYPSSDEEIDNEEYENYTESGGTLSLAQWRRNQVSALVGGIYSQIKSIDPQVVFGISPMGDIEKIITAVMLTLSFGVQREDIWIT